MRPIATYKVIPSLPKNLEALKEIVFNLWWCWNHEAISLFRRIDVDLWEEVDHNPVSMLGRVKQERLLELENDEGFLTQLERVYARFKDYMESKTWFEKTYEDKKDFRIAYFSMEFGIAESLPIYSGGLGILAGDHLKSSSELGIPLMGVGLLYQVGYFRQYLNVNGWQGERYPTNDFYNMPVSIVKDEKGKNVTVNVKVLNKKVTAQVWEAKVGRISLYLLDTNIDQNSDDDKKITRELYGGDLEMRMKQEILLGIGGLRALCKIGKKPDICHMNEGHSAFLALERIRMNMTETGLSFWEALEAEKAGNVFTTHTPVPAGIDVFSPALIEKYFGDYCANELKISIEELLSIGRQNPYDKNEPLSMAVLALKLADRCNGVSKLHGNVSRGMWKEVWKNVPENEIPISSVTNGIHALSWISHDMAILYDRYLGRKWLTEPANQTVWESAENIPGEELWRTHERRRERLVAFTRRRLVEQLKNRGALPIELKQAEEVLNPEALTIGFARRFATYKRATLLFKNPERLLSILTNKDMPVQIIFAGKAHPKDDPGKDLIRQIVHFAGTEEFRRNIVFIEDYEMTVARYMVQGVDVWLNTPRRFLEASGTSGMKAAANGVLNMSILDGWWDEAYHLDLGWAIGHGEIYTDLEQQDEIESEAIYDLLEKEIVPLFYSKGRDGLPRGWINKMKSTIKHLCPEFNTNRMVREYSEDFYFPSESKLREMFKENCSNAKELANWKINIVNNWDKIKIENIQADLKEDITVGMEFEIVADVYLGNLTHDDVLVQVYHGSVDPDNILIDAVPINMQPHKENGDKKYLFRAKVKSEKSGLMGYSLRVLPDHKYLTTNFLPGFIKWA